MAKTDAAVGTKRVALLLAALGLDLASFLSFVEWTLDEHLVAIFSSFPELGVDFFSRPDALKAFRTMLQNRTGRRWSQHDLEQLFARVKQAKEQHYRQPIRYEEYLKLLWQVPWQCAECGAVPPEVVLHVDHIVPASRGGSSERENLQFLCAKDNLTKSNRREVTGPWLDLL
jgi:5-methylcytosine-specific restriction endonuclease McrA